MANDSENYRTPSAQDDFQNIDLLIQSGSDYYQNKDFKHAEETFLLAYQEDSLNLTVLTALGNLCYDIHKNAEAIMYYEKVLEITPKNLDVRCDMATCFSAEGMMDKAIEINRLSIKMNYAHLQSHHNLSVFLKLNGDAEAALKEMEIYNELLARR